MVFFGGDNEGGNENSGDFMEVDQQRAAQEEAARLAEEEQKEREQENLLEQQEERELEEEVANLKLAHDNTDKHDEGQQQDSQGTSQNLNDLAGNDGIQAVIDALASAKVQVKEVRGDSKSANIEGVSKNSSGAGISNPSDGDDNDSSKDGGDNVNSR